MNQQQAEDQDRQRAVAEQFSRISRGVLVGAVGSLLLMVPAIYVLMRLESPGANIVVAIALVILPMVTGYAAACRGDRGPSSSR